MADHQHQDHHHDDGPVRKGNFIITGLTSGHGVFHWFIQSFFVLLPEVEQTFSLTKVQVGSIATTRELVSGIVTLPGGILADHFKKHWGLILALCMGLFGIGWFVVASAGSNDNLFFLVLVGTAIVASAASMWHLPAMASLSHHFAHRKGTALSFHGIGGNIGDAVSPIVTGFLLGYLTWQGILSIYAAAPIFIAFLVYWAFKNIGNTASEKDEIEDVNNAETRFQQTIGILKNPKVLLITLAGGIRGMAFIGFITFLPSYLTDLDYSELERGLHFGLLVAVGIIATPFMGYISDKIGRKPVLVPGMLFLAVVILLMVWFGDGLSLILLLALLGTFFYSDQPILTAAALDIVGTGVATTTLGSLSFVRFILSAASPIIAGFLYENYSMDHVFFYISALMLTSAIILLIIPLKPSEHPPSHSH